MYKLRTKELQITATLIRSSPTRFGLNTPSRRSFVNSAMAGTQGEFAKFAN